MAVKNDNFRMKTCDFFLIVAKNMDYGYMLEPSQLGGPNEYQKYMSRVTTKPVSGVSDQVRHKPGCTATEDGLRLEISDLKNRGIALSM